jgi:carboxypeptidase Q
MARCLVLKSKAAALTPATAAARIHRILAPDDAFQLLNDTAKSPLLQTSIPVAELGLKLTIQAFDSFYKTVTHSSDRTFVLHSYCQESLTQSMRSFMSAAPGRKTMVALTCVVLACPTWMSPSLAGDMTTREAVAKIKEIAARDSQVQDHLRYLCKQIGPRLTGSDNIQEAYEWTRDQFKSFGLEARLEQWGSAPIGFNRGQSTGSMISARGKKNLSFGTQSWTAGTDGPVRGPAILEPQSMKHIQSLGDKLTGAWIVARTTRRPGRGAQSKIREKLWTAGIAGVVTPVRSELIVTSGSLRGITWDKLPSRVQVRLVNSQWKELTAQMKTGNKIELEFDIQNKFKKGPIPHYNVIADIRGHEKPDEFVIVGGHIDTWDESEGATDNGTGVATALEAARLIVKAGVKPRRTIRFVLWSGEEQGLHGSKAYVKAHRDEMAKISAVLVHDGGTNTCSGISVTRAMMPQIQEAFAGVLNDRHKLPFKIRQVSGLRGGGSDHNSYLAVGVPGFFWTQKGKHIYRYTHHTQHDNFDQAVAEYQRRSTIVIATGALGIANLDELLNRENMRAPRRQRKVLGVQLADGMTIDSVSPGSIAARAGFKAGDKFVSGNGQGIKNINDLRAIIQAATGKTVFVIERSGAKKNLVAEFPGRQQRNGPSAGRRTLGVTLDGMAIASVSKGSVAEKAGLKVGDRFIKGSGKPINSIEDLRSIIQAARGSASFVVVRGDKEITLTAEFDAQPARKKKARLY